MGNEKISNLEGKITKGDYNIVYQPIVGREEYNYTYYCESLFRDFSSKIPVIDEIQLIEKLGLSNALIETELYKICSNLSNYDLKQSGVNRFTINISPSIIDCCRDVPELCNLILGYIYKYTMPTNIAFEL